ncbi:MAG: molybdopterin-dependent oxidoreductase [Candidatus Rokubacteria bacterium]|nr:molybdopterin-dependent oxidoreductase [Candidatus Rokubacteria bacterium]
MAPAPRFVGSAVKRLEDPRLIRGQAQYVDDLAFPGMLHAVVLRSPYAHARLTSLDVSEALAHPGVLAVLTAEDIAGKVRQKPLMLSPPGLKNPPRLPLARDEVRFVGDPVALILASEKYLARDAADLIRVEYDPLPVVTDPEAALRPGAPKVYQDLPDNLAYEHSWKSGDLDAAFATADRIVKGRFVNQRLAPLPLEPRGCLALFQGGALTLWTSTQMPHRAKSMLAETLDLPEHRIRVIAPEVGGGFGCKVGLYDEELLTAFAAISLGRPVKRIEARSESLAATTHGRGQIHEAELAVARDGTFLALRVSGVADLGAYLEAFTAGPPLLCGRLITGAYRIPAASYTLRGAFTNKTPTAAYRGAGRPEGSFIIERMADLASCELGLDPVEIRKQNFISPEDFPYKTPSGLTYDSGRYALTFHKALEILDYPTFRAEQARARTEGRYLGVGFSAFVETASTGPSRMMAFPGHEYGAVRVEPSGRVTALTGTSPHGQGSETVFAQIVADELGVTPEDVTVLHGDTAVVPTGFGTGGSRGASIGGAAICMASRRVKEKVRRIAAHLLEAAAEDIVLDDGRLHVKGLPDRAVTLKEVAQTAYRASNLPPGMEPGLDASHIFDPPDFTIPFGVYIAVVEVRPESGEVELRRFIGVDDVGTVINPLLLKGQLHGGIAQGIAQALWEEVVYDEAGQLLSGSLMEYAAPKAPDLPMFELDHTVTPTPHNPLGAKGVGEAGCVGAPQAVVNAVLDALAPLGITSLDMPLRPEKIWRAIRESRKSTPKG